VLHKPHSCQKKASKRLKRFFCISPKVIFPVHNYTRDKPGKKGEKAEILSPIFSLKVFYQTGSTDPPGAINRLQLHTSED
jgi:hypothetical protein